MPSRPPSWSGSVGRDRRSWTTTTTWHSPRFATPPAVPSSWPSAATARSARPPPRWPGRRVPLAVVPAGTGNVLAAAIGIGGRPGDPTIRHGCAARLDLGLARWATGLMREGTSGIFDGRLRHGLRRPGHGGRRARVEAPDPVRGVRRRGGARGGTLRPATFQIEADGDDIEIHGLVVLIANCGDLVPGRVGARRPIDPDRRLARPAGRRRASPARRSAGRRRRCSGRRRPARRGRSAAASSHVRDRRPSPPSRSRLDGDPQPPGLAWRRSRLPARPDRGGHRC